MTWPRGTRSPQPLHLRSKGGLGLVSISYGTAIMRRFQLDWNGSFEIGSAATEGGFLPVLISHGSTQMHRLRYTPLANLAMPGNGRRHRRRTETTTPWNVT